jgi:hypothetical protein
MPTMIPILVEEVSLEEFVLPGSLESDEEEVVEKNGGKVAVESSETTVPLTAAAELERFGGAEVVAAAAKVEVPVVSG